MRRLSIIGFALLALAGCATQTQQRDPVARAEQMFRQMPLTETGQGAPQRK